MRDDETTPDDDGFPGNVLGFAEKFLRNRYLGGLSEQKRNQLRSNLGIVRRTLLDQRAPRIAVAGFGGRDLEGLLAAISGDAVPDELNVKEYLGRERWYDYELRGVELELLDVRRVDDEAPSLEALDYQIPDVILVDWECREPSDDASSGASDEDWTIRDLERIVDRIERPDRAPAHIIALVDDADLPEGVTPNRAVRILESNLRDADLQGSTTRVIPRRDVRELDLELVEMAPLEARMQLARAVQTAGSKRRLARSIIRASAGLSAAIASVPLPFADIVPITGVQFAMVAAIGHLSGRQMSLKTVGEFAAALGANVTAGYAVREISRAILQFVPFAGAMMSSGITAGATYAIGNSAARYFIDEQMDEFDAAPEHVEEAG